MPRRKPRDGSTSSPDPDAAARRGPVGGPTGPAGEIIVADGHDQEPDGEPDLAELEDLPEELVAGGGLTAAGPAALLPDLDLDDDEQADLHEDLLPAVAEGRGRGGSLVKTDPLTAYMQEIRRYPLLSREEEHELAVRYARSREPALGRRLITANLRLVVKIAHEYRRAYRNLLDLVQEGNLGLLQAVQKYDPHRGVKLSSYASWWIRAYMLKFILNNWRLVKIGTTQAQRKLFFNLSKERDKLESEGIAATNQQLAERLSVPEREVADMQLRLGSGEMSLDAPVGRDEEPGRTQVDMLESAEDSRPDVTTAGREFREMLHGKFEEFRQTLKDDRERTLFTERMVADTPLTLQEVGEKYKISRERARQLEARLMARLKAFLKKELGDDAVQVAIGLED